MFRAGPQPQPSTPSVPCQTPNTAHNHKYRITNTTTNTQPQTHSNKHTTTNTQTQSQTHNNNKHITTNTKRQTHNHKHTTTNTQPQTHNHNHTTTNTPTTNTCPQTHVELLRHLASAALGLDILTFMLNSLLRDPASAHCALGTGWVVLLPKTVWIDHASGFRPIVCGEVFAKLAARLATLRVTASWPVPDCCFGSVKTCGLPEALYIVKHIAQESAGLDDSTVFLQLDLSRAFDSLYIHSLLQFLVDHWSPAAPNKAAATARPFLGGSLLDGFMILLACGIGVARFLPSTLAGCSFGPFGSLMMPS